MQTARTRRLAAAAIAVIALLPASQGIAPAGPARAALTNSGTWSLQGLPAGARANFLTDAADVVPASRPVLALIDGSIAVDTNVGRCLGSGVSCSYPAAAGSGTAWQIHLSPEIAANTYKGQRFIVLHELGHAVWDMVLGESDQQAFIAAARATLHGQPCRRVRSGQPCAPVHELFADEFARWAGGFAVSMSCYETPALVDAATFGAIVDHAMAALPSGDRA